MKKPLISVIIPVYNRSNLLKEAVNSVMSQSFADFELIIADDCSEEDIQKAVETLLVRENISIKFLRLQKHSGMPGLVRNFGCKAAEGRYIAFLDSDDLWLPDKLEKQVARLAGNSAVSICHTREIWQRGEKVVSQASQRHKREGDIFEDALAKCIMGPSTVIMERGLFEKLGGFREDIEIAEDYELWLRVTAGSAAAYIDEPLVIKRTGDWPQLSEKYGQIEIFRINALKQLVESAYFSGEKMVLAKRALAEKCRIYAAGCRKRGREDEAVLYDGIIAQIFGASLTKDA
ncbi:MAG: glycosyltransferase family 2 protein [Spirochaetes bacterium]|nr:glycosyltransferase family 2 protein [Spirochaetota bacterium]